MMIFDSGLLFWPPCIFFGFPHFTLLHNFVHTICPHWMASHAALYSPQWCHFSEFTQWSMNCMV